MQTIRKLAGSLPGAEEGTSYGTPAWRVGGKLFLRMHGDGDAAVIMLGSVEDQENYIEADPDTFFITDHYRGHAAVLVNLAITEERFREVLMRAWKRVARAKDLTAFEQRG